LFATGNALSTSLQQPLSCLSEQVNFHNKVFIVLANYIKAGMAAACLAVAYNASALDNAQAMALLDGEPDARVSALRAQIASINASDTAAVKKFSDFLEQLNQGALRIQTATIVVVSESNNTAKDLNGNPVVLTDSAQEPIVNNRLRKEYQSASALLDLLDKDLGKRNKAATALRETVELAHLPVLDTVYKAERDSAMRNQIAQLRASVLLVSKDKAQRLEAAQLLASSDSVAARPLIQQRLKPANASSDDADSETDEQVRTELKLALNAIEARLAWGERLGMLFTGLSLGSILLLVALGLAITYGLMGVINMAHGELMMLGAYATYLVQLGFKTYAPAAFNYYLLAALPIAFLCAAMMGAFLERTIIRHLYGRPLETLLATWGISLMLIQLVRSIFGAQNVQVENPAALSGGIQIFSNLILPYNRIAILIFSLVVLASLATLISGTRLGLFIRSVTQNRRMAACVGVHTARVDTYAFALGSGIAGLAGCALTQIGNVGPDLGQTYIVDAFLVVVLGGVGQLLGTVYAALGLGVFNKILEGWQGAVLAKIMVLVVIVLIIQKRPQGLFALKGRSVE
jgi:urea transport system permease protein